MDRHGRPAGGSIVAVGPSPGVAKAETGSPMMVTD
jgi:hypothetical protein